MKYLSGMDSLFLAMDRGHNHMHVASLGIYDPSTAPGGKVRFKAVLNYFSSRLNLAKVFRRRLVRAPLGLDRPYWIEDGEIDIEYHVRHIALPHPGDWRQLMIQLARIHARPLDMTKPLWEAYIIEGLDNIPGIPEGGFALYTKMHHSAIDGESGAELTRVLHSLSPEPTPDELEGSGTVVAEREPNAAELFARAAGNRARQAYDGSKLVFALGSRASAIGRELIASGRALEIGKELIANRGKRAKREGSSDGPAGKPITRFDKAISAHRVIDAVGFPLADCSKIRQNVEKVTINDIFLAAAGGAVRLYLDAKGELPDKSINAMVPVSTRGEDKGGDVGNQIGMTVMPLRSDVADPIERLLAVRRGSGKVKATTEAIGKELPGQLIQVLPARVGEFLLKKGVAGNANITVSNVRGPNMPLFMAGAQLVLFIPISAIADEVGLNITGFSYNGTLWVCFVSCRAMMPDPDFFADCLNQSFDEMVNAAVALGSKNKMHGRAAIAKPKPAAKVAVKAKPVAVKPTSTKQVKSAKSAKLGVGKQKRNSRATT